MQMVSALRILTARPSEAEEAKAEHALYGVLAPHDPTSVAVWLGRAEPVIRHAWDAGKLPLLVGGTGMYIKALMEGLAAVPPVPEALRTALRALDGAAIRARLEALDPVMAAALKPGDRQRNLRALEVIEATGVSLSEWQRRTSAPIFPDARYDLFAVMKPRAEIYARIDARFTAMMEQGALDEVRTLMDMDLDPELPILRAHGVPELMAYLKGTMSRADAIARGQQNTRNYAKRQMTWLKHQLPGATLLTDNIETALAVLAG
jgi:tRNA dimethylallyltransferase